MKCNELNQFYSCDSYPELRLVSNTKSHDCSSEQKQLYCQCICSNFRQLEESKVRVLHCRKCKDGPHRKDKMAKCVSGMWLRRRRNRVNTRCQL